jgi:hypothetical protein
MKKLVDRNFKNEIYKSLKKSKKKKKQKVEIRSSKPKELMVGVLLASLAISSSILTWSLIMNTFGIATNLVLLIQFIFMAILAFCCITLADELSYLPKLNH